MIKKIIMGAVAGILTCSAAYSQVETKQEVSVYAADGLSTLQYSVENADRKGSFGEIGRAHV